MAHFMAHHIELSEMSFCASLFAALCSSCIKFSSSCVAQFYSSSQIMTPNYESSTRGMWQLP